MTTPTRARRDYAPLIHAARAFMVATPAADRAARMKQAVDLLFDAFGSDGLIAPGSDKGISWIGFYEKSAGDEMILLERRDKPACSPIGLFGACGRGWREQRSLVIPDIRSLGAGYIACDPRDRSEVVVPCFDAAGTCWGVLDGDSHDLAGFDEHDASELESLLRTLGLTFGPPAAIARV
jgi:putative methionine-R-sulfoxide reductase with GAF domain